MAICIGIGPWPLGSDAWASNVCSRDVILRFKFLKQNPEATHVPIDIAIGRIRTRDSISNSTSIFE